MEERTLKLVPGLTNGWTKSHDSFGNPSSAFYANLSPEQGLVEQLQILAFHDPLTVRAIREFVSAQLASLAPSHEVVASTNKSSSRPRTKSSDWRRLKL